jgi:hypothetical protein
MLRLKSPWLQPAASFFLAVYGGILLWLGLVQPRQWAWCVVGFLAVVAMVAARNAVTRVEINREIVKYDEGWRARTREVARDQVRVIRRYPTKIVFGGPDGKHIMSLGGHWTMKQLMQIAQVLGVPLFDHRRWLGARSVKTGRPVAVGEAPAVGQPS